MELTERNQSLKIAVVRQDNVGKYSCVVKNRLNEESARGYVTIAGEKERERTLCCIDGPVIQNNLFFYCVVYKLKMVQLCSIEMKLPMCTNVSYDTESGFLLFKV